MNVCDEFLELTYPGTLYSGGGEEPQHHKRPLPVSTHTLPSKVTTILASNKTETFCPFRSLCKWNYTEHILLCLEVTFLPFCSGQFSSMLECQNTVIVLVLISVQMMERNWLHKYKVASQSTINRRTRSSSGRAPWGCCWRMDGSHRGL